MRGIIKRLFGPAEVPTFDAPLIIDRPTYAIGDIHGRFDLLVPLMRAVLADAQGAGIDTPRLVFMGDYVDRGEQSRQVLDFLLDLARGNPGGAVDDTETDVVLLRGNHEEMLLDFLRDPAGEGPRWLRSGGLQTLLSYGVGNVTASADASALTAAASRLRDAMGPTVDALSRLPTAARYGDVFFSHAGADPGLPTQLQSQRTLVWGARAMFTDLRDDGVWVVHGHYVVDEAELTRGRIPVDTGAYYSGKLTAARLMDGDALFLTAEI
jgi:serine/threonine protein phosphatase 1